MLNVAYAAGSESATARRMSSTRCFTADAAYFGGAIRCHGVVTLLLNLYEGMTEHIASI